MSTPSEKENPLFIKDKHMNIYLISAMFMPVLLWYIFLGKLYYDGTETHIFKTPIYLLCMLIPLIYQSITLAINLSDNTNAPIIYGPIHPCFKIINDPNTKYYGYFNNKCGTLQLHTLLKNSSSISDIIYSFNNTLLLLMLVITVILKKNILSYKSFRMFTAIIMVNGFLVSLFSFIASLQQISAIIKYLMISLLSVSLASFLMVILGFNRIHFGFP
jgi:hypothetical protein